MATANGGVSALVTPSPTGTCPPCKHVSDVVAITSTPDGKGYYLVGVDGGFFTFGDAKFRGSLPGIGVHTKHVVDMVATPTGTGYLLVGWDGGEFTFGDAHFYGSLPGLGIHVKNIRDAILSSRRDRATPSAAPTGACSSSAPESSSTAPCRAIHVRARPTSWGSP